MSDFEKDLANVMGSFIETELDFIEKSHNETEKYKKALLDIKELLEHNQVSLTKLELGFGIVDFKKQTLHIINKALGSDSNE